MQKQASNHKQIRSTNALITETFHQYLFRRIGFDRCLPLLAPRRSTIKSEPRSRDHLRHVQGTGRGGVPGCCSCWCWGCSLAAGDDLRQLGPLRARPAGTTPSPTSPASSAAPSPPAAGSASRRSGCMYGTAHARLSCYSLGRSGKSVVQLVIEQREVRCAVRDAVAALDGQRWCPAWPGLTEVELTGASNSPAGKWRPSTTTRPGTS